LTRGPAQVKHPFMAIDPRYLTFGEAMAFRRRQLKLKQSDLAARVRMSRASIANIERGRQNVLLHHACDIAAALQLARVDDLLPAEPRASLEDQVLAVSADVSAKAKAQLTDMIANALAAAPAKARP